MKIFRCSSRATSIYRKLNFDSVYGIASQNSISDLCFRKVQQYSLIFMGNGVANRFIGPRKSTHDLSNVSIYKSFSFTKHFRRRFPSDDKIYFSRRKNANKGLTMSERRPRITSDNSIRRAKGDFSHRVYPGLQNRRKRGKCPYEITGD